jgi:hypothetical protein
VSGPGPAWRRHHGGHPDDLSCAIISGATYSQFANGVVLEVTVVYGEHLKKDQITVEVALTAVGAEAKPGKPLKLEDPDCAAPTATVPTAASFF